MKTNSRKTKATSAKTASPKTNAPKMIPPPMNVSELTARLARDNQRINRFVESLSNHVDLLVDAAGAGDWAEVSRQADYLAGSGASHGCQELAERASQLGGAMKSGERGADLSRHIIKVIGACGRARHSTESAT